MTILYFTFANEHVYKRGERYDPAILPGDGLEHDSRRALGLLGIKHELDYLGFNDGGLKLDLPAFGAAMLYNVKRFQQAAGLKPDGDVGYYTTYRLFWCYAAKTTRLREIQTKADIPNNYLGKLISLESGYYPSAANSQGDMGLAQENHPSDIAAAYDPAKAIQYAADRLVANHRVMQKIGGTWTHVWWAAIFAHNAPAFADDWLRAGCPETGGPPIMVGGRQWEMFTWATTYKDAVVKQQCL